MHADEASVQRLVSDLLGAVCVVAWGCVIALLLV